MHDEMGRPCSRPENAKRVIEHLVNKIECKKEEITITRKYNLDDAKIVIICYGGMSRAALSAMKEARRKGIKVGVLQIITVWPLPEKEIDQVMEYAEKIIVPELNLGQYICEIEKRNKKNIPIIGVNRIDSEIVFPKEILSAIEEV